MAGDDHSCLAERGKTEVLAAAACAPGPSPTLLPQPPALLLSLHALQQQDYTLESSVLGGAPALES